MDIESQEGLFSSPLWPALQQKWAPAVLKVTTIHNVFGSTQAGEWTDLLLPSSPLLPNPFLPLLRLLSFLLFSSIRHAGLTLSPTSKPFFLLLNRKKNI